MRIVFMGTPEFAVPSLEALVEAGHDVVSVYTQPDRPAGRGRALAASPVKKRAIEYELDIYQPRSLRGPEEAARLQALAPDLIVVAAFGQILPESILEIPTRGALNVHPSLLPRHRGASPIASAILAGDQVTGVSIMLMDKGMDTGPVVTQVVVPVESEDTTGSLTEKLSMIGARLLVETVPGWVSGDLPARPQDSQQATYSRPIDKKSARIDWTLSAEQIWRQVRAYHPWPGSFTTWQGKVLKVILAVPAPGDGPPGKVVNLPHNAPAPIGVCAGEGVVALLRVQMEGKQVVSSQDFVRGYRQFAGSTLPS